MSGEFQGDKMQDHAKRKAPKDGEVSAVAEETPEEKKSSLGDVRVRAERIKDEMRVQGDDLAAAMVEEISKKALSDPELTQPQVGKQLLDSFNYDDSGQSLDPDVKLTSFHKAMEYFAEFQDLRDLVIKKKAEKVQDTASEEKKNAQKARDDESIAETRARLSKIKIS
ncbi:MAG: hypothetical protein AAB953_03620 [Patescibacteria group bacterium]